MDREFAEKMGSLHGLSDPSALLLATPSQRPAERSARRPARPGPLLRTCISKQPHHPAVTSPELPTPCVSQDSLPRLILDTQVVMEWLVFRDPGIRALVDPIEGGRWLWIGSAAMRDELLHVLSRGVAARWKPDPSAIASVFERLCQMPAPSAEGVTVPLLKCRDKDDQKFIDLALAQQIDALISRDADVLALAKRARKLGLAILRPEQWLQQQAQAAAAAPTAT